MHHSARRPAPRAAAVQATLTFALNGAVFLFAGARWGAVSDLPRFAVWHRASLTRRATRRPQASLSPPLPNSAVNFMVRAVEGLGDYGRAFALFPPIYLALFAIRRGACWPWAASSCACVFGTGALQLAELPL